MTNNKLTDERLMQIADAAEAVLSALAELTMMFTLK